MPSKLPLATEVNQC